ncbi:uncharacterized protein [Antedon mediterranea]|uniref:uncharacterized protein n=1 Tax=Antedon mediterranea TaxID=105859 RepID=UPI003AF84FE4
MASESDTYSFIRKLRKKLRQIERLETVNRVLTDEEKLKVSRKEDLRNTLHEKLSELGDESFEENNFSFETQQSSFESAAVDDLLNNSEEQTRLKDCSEEVKEFEMKRKANEDEEEESENEETVSRLDERIPPKVSKTGDGAGENKVPSPSTAKAELLTLKQRKESPSPKQASETSKPGKTNSQTTKFSKSTSQSSSKPGSPASIWATAKFSVHVFEGHNDLIGAVDCLGDTIISGGRDTMVKIWNMENKEEQHSFGGHTGTVTSVKLLDSIENRRLENVVDDLPEGCQLALSSSLDCSIKLWCISSATMVRSMYTYNPVTCMGYFPGVGYIVSGSDGGKVELWDIESGNNLFSTLAHDSVTCIWVDGSHAFTGAEEGIIKVWELREKSLVTLYSSENIELAPSRKLSVEPVKCLTSFNQKIYYGNDGQNIKVLSWKAGKLTKLKNHTSDFGLTDSVAVKDGLLISTGLDVDSGNSFVNVRVLPEEIYVATVTDEDVGRIVKIAISKNREGTLRLVTVGSELIVWDLERQKNRNPESISIEFISSLSTKACDTDQDSDSDVSSDEDYGSIRTQRRRSSTNSTKQNPSWSWCSVI